MLDRLKKVKYLFLLQKRSLYIIIVCLLSCMLLNFMLPFFTQALIDYGFEQKNIESIFIISIVILLINALMALIKLLKKKHQLNLYTTVRKKLEKDAIRHLLNIDMSYFADNNSASIYYIIKEDVTTISSIVNEETFETILAFVSAIGGGIALTIIDWHLALTVIFFTPINFIIGRLITKKNIRIVRDYNKESKEYSKIFGAVTEGIKEIRIGNIQDKVYIPFIQKLEQILDLNKQKQMLFSFHQETQMLLFQVLITFLYIIAGVLMIHNGFTIGGVIAFETYALMMVEPIISGICMLFGISSIYPSIDRYYEFMEYKEEEFGDTENMIQANPGTIMFNNVTFAYKTSSNNVLQNISFSIPYGKKVAIIGKNGIGKTTILNLILRINNVTQGEILLDDKNILEYSASSYRSLFSVVSQETYLYNLSIKENICIYNQESENRLDDIVRMVNLSDLIMEKGYSYIVGENGCNLSGGQRQKIALARVIASNRPYVVLDEFTSNLDKKTIEIIRKLFVGEFREKTVICVTHTEDFNDLFNDIIIVNEKGICHK